MNILNNMNLYYGIGGAVLLVLILIIVFVVIKRKPKGNIVNFENYEKVFNALGENNITSVEKQQDRIRLILKDVKLVDAKALNDLKIPAFLKGNEIKLLFRENSNELVKYLKAKLKEWWHEEIWRFNEFTSS